MGSSIPPWPPLGCPDCVDDMPNAIHMTVIDSWLNTCTGFLYNMGEGGFLGEVQCGELFDDAAVIFCDDVGGEVMAMMGFPPLMDCGEVTKVNVHCHSFEAVSFVGGCLYIIRV